MSGPAVWAQGSEGCWEWDCLVWRRNRNAGARRRRARARYGRGRHVGPILTGKRCRASLSLSPDIATSISGSESQNASCKFKSEFITAGSNDSCPTGKVAGTFAADKLPSAEFKFTGKFAR